MKFVFISDTHGKHSNLQLPEGDVLVHAGDLSPRGSAVDLQQFFFWFGRQPHKYKVCIAGNHDFLAETDRDQFRKLVPEGVTYLEDEGIEIEGIKIWGSPVTPWFYDWAFNRRRGPDLARYWKMIPKDTDILVTHGPPMGILDRTNRGEHVGCEDLLARVEFIQPRVHVFGHIHEAYGMAKQKGTTFINASVLNLQYQMANKAVKCEIEKD